MQDGGGIEHVNAVGNGRDVLKAGHRELGVAPQAAAAPGVAATVRPTHSGPTDSPTATTVPPTPLPGT